MAANTLPSGIGDLFQLAGRMEGGLAVHGPWLLKGTVMPEEFGEIISATRKAESNYATARAGKAAAGKRFAEADAALTSWLAKARLVVMLAYGSKWSESWIAAGFTHRGTNVPKRIAARMELSRRLAEFFAEHREYEVAFAGVTVAEARPLQKEIAGAERAMRLAGQDAQAKKRTRDAAERKLRCEMHFVVSLLPCAIEKSDPRWRAFGLKQPRSDDPAEKDIRNLPAPAAAAVKIDFLVGHEPASDSAAAA
ncbi:MAG: hypothetical protein ABI217_03850 [Chthoniobacterales bacterium]